MMNAPNRWMQCIGLTACSLLLALSAKGQRLDVFGGFNMTKLTHETTASKTKEGGVFGYHAGVAVFLPFNMKAYNKDEDKEGYGVFPALQFVRKGTSKNSVIANTAADIRLGFLQLNLPLVFTTNNIDIGVGPYAAYAISGSKKYRVGNAGKERIDWSADLNRIDYGLSVQFTLYLFKFQYEWGMANLAKGPDNVAKSRNFSLSLNVPLVQ